MYDHDARAVPLEVKFASDATTGDFEGYGAIFGSQDSHGDLILPGAFAASLAKRTAEKRSLPMYIQHGPHVGGDHLPAGVWKAVEEDATGLKMAGQIAGMDTERGKLVHSLIKQKALAGLSIEFSVPRGGAVYGKAAGEPRRTIKTANLFGVSLVADPSHADARVVSMKSAVAAGELPTLEAYEDFLRDAGGFSRSQAKALAGHGLKHLLSQRDAGREVDDHTAFYSALLKPAA